MRLREWFHKSPLVLIFCLSALFVFTISRLYSAVPPLTIVSVGNEPRGGAFNPSTNKGVVSNHNSNTVTIINATNYATTTVTVGSHPYGVAVNNSTNKAYIANEQSDSVSVLTLSTNTVSATIPAGANPRGIAVNATTNVGVVANSKANTVSILNLATNAVTATLTVGTDPEGVVINTANNSAYVTNYGSSTVSVINLANNTVTATINVGLGPMGIDINTTSAMIMVANRYSNTVSVINPATNTVTATINVGLAPFGVAVNSSTGLAYVSNEYSDSVSVIKMSTNTITTTYAAGENPEGIAVVPSLSLLFVVNDKANQVYIINLANPPTTSPSPTGTDPEGVVVDLSTNTAVTANSKTNNLSVINLSNSTVIATISVGKGPQDVALNPNTGELVTANSRDNTATIIDYPSRTVLATVNVGNRPKAVAIDPGLNIAAVANELDGTLSLINLATYSITATLPAGSHPADIAINPNTHIAVVANKKTDLVTVINLQTQTIVTTISVGKDPVSVSINPNTNIAVVSNQKSNSVSIINLNTNTVTTTVSGILNPMGSDINLSTNIAAIISHEVPTLTLIDLSTNTVSATLSGTGPDPEDVAINPNTNIAVVTNETSLGVSLVQLPNPVPILTSLSPSSATAGGSSFTLLLTGSKFVTTSTITFSNLTITPQFISTNQVSAAIPASAITTAGSVTVNVINPTPGGGKSNGLTFTINPALPSISSITPSSATAGGANFQMIIMGSQFATSSTVNFSGTTLTPVFVSSSQLNVTIPASNIATAGLYPVKVVNTGGLNSNSVTFTVNNPAPGLTGMTPVSMIAGSGDTKVTLTGSNFVTSSTVNFSGQVLTPQFVNSTTLNVTMPASNITSAGLFPVKVTNPGPGGGTSSSITFTVNNAVPFLTSLTPNFIIAGGGDTKVTLTGSYFVTSSTINYSGHILIPQFVNSTTLNVTIPASSIAGAGLYPVNVSNPVPGGGLSNSATFTVNNPAPILTALSPAAVVPGSGEFRLTLSGNNFVSSSTITFDNQLLIPGFINSTQINVTVPGSLIASAHTATVTLNNPTPGGGISNILNLIVNTPPVANAGINQNGTVGTKVTIDGRKSYDSDPGDLIAFHWLLLSVPAGSTISLGNSTSVTPAFTPDIAGTYQVQLIVNDGKTNSAPSTVTITAYSGNSPPNADRGGDLNALVGQNVTLDGRKSLDPDNDKISYQWSLLSAPAGSTTTVIDSTSVIPSLTPDLAGNYQLQLVVTDVYNNTGGATINISASSTNAAPMAKGGRDQNVLTGSLVTLDGTGSKDPNGFPLSYQWSFVSVPAGSTTTIGNSTAPNPAFTPDLSGDYLIKLVVNNGTSNSAPGLVIIRAASPNAAPNAVAGADQLIYQTDTVTLDGSASSDPNGDPLTYAWLMVSTPAGSQAAFSNTTAVNPTFVADVNGAYVARLTVSDGVNSSFADVVVVKTKALISIALGPVNPAITLGQTVAFTATGTFVDSTSKNLTNLVSWSSSNLAVATVNSFGTATALQPGTSQIAASYGSIASPLQTLTVTNPVPQISSLSPASIDAGSGDFLLTITGSNFLPTSTVSFRGQILTPQYVSSGQINVTVPASAVNTPGSAQVSVANPSPGGGASNSLTFAINNPGPVITSISPSSSLAPTFLLSMTITGQNFLPSSTVQIPNTGNFFMKVLYVSSTELVVFNVILGSGGYYPVTVTNPPGPSGGVSNAVNYTVFNPVPQLSALSPTSIIAGSGNFQLTLDMSTTLVLYPNVTTVNFNGQSFPLQINSFSQWFVTIPALAITTAGNISVSVTNPAPGGGTSNSLNFAVVLPTPIVRSMSQSTAPAGSPDLPITITGSNFLTSSTVSFNGNLLTPAYISSTALSVTVPSVLLATAGYDYLMVINPTLGGGGSNLLTFAVSNPAPSLGALSQTVVWGGDADLLLTLTGSNFVSTSIVNYSGLMLTPQFVSSSQLNVTIPASLMTVGGAYPISVTNTAPGGGNTTAINFTVYQINITYPANGAVLNRPDTLVTGTLPSINEEVGVTVNGVIAQVSGTSFAASHVPLVSGGNTVTVTRTSLDGTTHQNSISLTVQQSSSYTQLNSNMQAGVGPFNITLSADIIMPYPIATSNLTYTGPDIANVTFVTSTQYNVTVTATPGIYLYNLTMTDTQGNQYQDSVSVEVNSVTVIDSLLRGKWNAMINFLTQGDVNSALALIAPESQQRYQQIFSLVNGRFATIFSNIQQLNLVSIYNQSAIYEVITREGNGKLYSYPVTFTMDDKGLWKIQQH